MAATSEFAFDHRIAFSPENAEALLRDLPAAPAVFALRGLTGEPYLTRAADLRRRLRRLLAPPEAAPDGVPILSKRLNLRSRVHFIEWTRTGSDFESTLLLYHASRAAYGPEEARRRLRLHAPFFLRVTLSHEHPRVYATNRLSKRSLPESFGPFPSRAAADRYADAVLDLFQLRRCYEDLAPYPEHPGCVYGEMNKCLRPCQQGAPTACTPAQYSAEAHRVQAFFTTRGQSLLDEVAAQREAASEAMDFELAATLHKHWEKVKSAAALADELVRPIADLRAVILQQAATTMGGPFIASHFDAMGGVAQELIAPHLASEVWDSTNAQESTESAAVFLLEHGHLCGPEPLSTLGVRAVREQTAVGSSLFAQPLMLAPVPLAEPAPGPVIPSDKPSPQHKPVILSEGAEHHPAPQSKDPETLNPTTTSNPFLTSLVLSTGAQRSGEIAAFRTTPAASTTTLNPEDRARQVLATLAAQTEAEADTADLCDALALFRRWYYRPEKQRTGEVFLPNPDHSWPIRRILNGAARIVLGPPTQAAPVDREAAKVLKTKIIHAGREGVEREVPVLPKRPRTRKAITPADVMEQ